MLLSEYTYFVEESELEEPPAKRIVRDDGGSTKKSKLWGCLLEIISESASSNLEESMHNSEVDQHLYLTSNMGTLKIVARQLPKLPCIG